MQRQVTPQRVLEKRPYVMGAIILALGKAPMNFDIESVRSAIAPAKLIFFPTLGSTNRYVLDHAETFSANEPTLVLTEQQTAGQGRRGKNWVSKPGNLTFSWVVCSQASRAHLLPMIPRLSLQTADSVQATLQDFIAAPKAIQNSIQIKWPNDLVCGNRKLAGILIETAYAQQGTVVCIGIGINVNAPIELVDTDDELRDLPPVSLAEIAGRALDLSALMMQLGKRLNRDLGNIPTGVELDQHRISAHLFGRNRRAMVSLPDRQVEGIIIGIDHDGALVLKTESTHESLPTGTLRFSGNAADAKSSADDLHHPD